jgi:hypothetical protein
MPGFDEIRKFLEDSNSGLKLVGSDLNQFLLQTADGKSLKIKPQSVETVLKRDDSDGNPFLQVNFITGHKVLLTKHLIGFKPSEGYGLDETRLPKVVTTPDLLSIIDVIADADDFDHTEFDVLRKVYLSILDGGEAVGFDLSRERQWLSQLNIFIATA